MCVAQGVSPGIVKPPKLPPPSTFRRRWRRNVDGGGWGTALVGPRADALGYIYSAPLGLKTYPELTSVETSVSEQYLLNKTIIFLTRSVKKKRNSLIDAVRRFLLDESEHRVGETQS
jgi:hypothetical protein